MFISPQFVSDNLPVQLVLPDLNQAKALFAIIANHRDDLKPWMAWVTTVKSIEDEEAFLLNSQQQMYKQKLFLLTICVEGSPAGVITLYDLDFPNHHGKVSYWLSPQYQGHGIASRCLERVLAYTFNQLHLHKLQVWADAFNYKAQHVAQRMGFEHEATMKEELFFNERYHDMEVYCCVNLAQNV